MSINSLFIPKAYLTLIGKKHVTKTMNFFYILHRIHFIIIFKEVELTDTQFFFRGGSWLVHNLQTSWEFLMVSNQRSDP